VPKLKTHRGAYKRFKLSGSGKLQQPKAWKNHLRRRRSARAKRALHDQVPTTKGNAKQVTHLLPYGTR
jgi:large subunit ribosomal protein L35